MVESPHLGVHKRQESSSTLGRDVQSVSSGSRLSSRKQPPKVRKVNDYIIFYDDVIGKGSFGTVVKA